MYKKIKFKKFVNENELFKKCLSIFKKEIINKNIIVTGGNTYKSFYSILCKKEINWKNVNLILSDERLTSKMAIKSLVMQGIKTGHNKHEIDKTSAAIFLQNYLDDPTK